MWLRCSRMATSVGAEMFSKCKVLGQWQKCITVTFTARIRKPIEDKKIIRAAKNPLEPIHMGNLTRGFTTTRRGFDEKKPQKSGTCPRNKT